MKAIASPQPTPTLHKKANSDRDIHILIRLTPNTRQGLLTLAKIKHDLEAIIRTSRRYCSERSD